MTDYYDILQLRAGASLEEAQEQYRSRLRPLHPDNFTGADREAQLAQAEMQTRQLNEAYDAFKEEDTRRRIEWERQAAEDPYYQVLGQPGSEPSASEGPTLEHLSVEDDEHPLFRMAPPRGYPGQVGLARWRRSTADGWRKPTLAGGLLLGGIVTVVAYSYIGNGGSPSAGQEAAAAMPPAQQTVVSAPVRHRAVLTRQQLTARSDQRTENVEEPVHASRTKQPIRADVILPKGAQMFGAEQVGNIEVIYADGTQDTWTTRGNCGKPRVAPDGTVGWTVSRASNTGTSSTDFQPNATLVLCRHGRLLSRVNSTLDYIEDWAFLDGGKAVALRTRGIAGGAVMERHECATGRLLDKVNEDGANLPPWAQSFGNP